MSAYVPMGIIAVIFAAGGAGGFARSRSITEIESIGDHFKALALVLVPGTILGVLLDLSFYSDVDILKDVIVTAFLIFSGYFGGVASSYIWEMMFEDTSILD